MKILNAEFTVEYNLDEEIDELDDTYMMEMIEECFSSERYQYIPKLVISKSAKVLGEYLFKHRDLLNLNYDNQQHYVYMSEYELSREEWEVFCENDTIDFIKTQITDAIQIIIDQYVHHISIDDFDKGEFDDIRQNIYKSAEKDRILIVYEDDTQMLVVDLY